MPSLKACRLQHVQDILSGKKKHLLQKDTPSRKVPLWSELAVKNMYDQIIKLHPDVLEYLPDLQGSDGNTRFPEREFFYKVLYKLHPETVDELINQAAQARQP